MIVIEGLTMPKGEDDGILIALYDGKAHQIGTKETFAASEVPAHGRLIDADRLLSERMKRTYYHLPNGDTAIPIIDIEYAPTIVPAEEGET